MVAWVNAELMKNATEIGQLRLLRAASVQGEAAASRLPHDAGGSLPASVPVRLHH
jgi:hypothetical protein